MVPSALVVLERLPLTPNGKLDRRALPAPEPARSQAHRAPRTPQEAMLCGLFAEVLGLERVGIDDNFFALGGDSIVSIQLVSRARRAGLSITPRAVFQHQTVAALAAAAELVGGGGTRRCRGRRCAAAAAVAATPIMRWLQERGGPIERFSQAMLLQVPAGLREEHLTAALQACWIITTRCGCGSMRRGGRRTGALRSRRPGRSRRAAVCGGSTVGGSRRRRSAARSVMAAEAMRRSAGSIRRPGVMVQAVWFDAGRERAGRLWLAIHHLAVDGVSWRILVPDLAAAWRAVAAGQAVDAAGAGHVVAALGGAACGAGARCRGGGRAFVLARDAERAVAAAGRTAATRSGARRAGQAGHLTLTLPAGGDGCAADAGAGGVPRRHQRRAAERAGLAVADWCRRHGRAAVGRIGGSHAVLLDLEGHGREEASAARRCARRRRPDADGGLVHQPLSGAARSGPARSRRGAGGRAGAGPGAEEHQGAVARGAAATGSAMGCCAISTRRPRRSLPGCRRRSSASTTWAGSPAGEADDAGDWAPVVGRRCEAAAGRRRRCGDAAGAC